MKKTVSWKKPELIIVKRKDPAKSALPACRGGACDGSTGILNS